MAKYEIVSAGTAGQYTVKEHLDVALISGKISQLQTEITTLQTRNTEIDGQIPPLETELQSVQAQIEIALTTTPPDSEKAQKLTKYSFTISSTIGNLQRQKTDNDLKIAQNNKVVIRLQAVLDQQSIVQSAVCIDGDDTLTAGLIVGSIELNRFPRDKSSGKVLIRPGAEAPYTAARDGITRNAISMGASELFVNQALLPPAQAYLPRFVAAIVDSIDTTADTISATPYIEPNNHPATWWEGATPVRMPASSYTNIPVVYKTCNAGAFTVGDKVVVEYIAGQPTVVGFVDNPQPCEVKSLWRASYHISDTIKVVLNSNSPIPTAPEAIFDFPGIQYDGSGGWLGGGGAYYRDFVDGSIIMRVHWTIFEPHIYYFEDRWQASVSFLVSHWGLCMDCDVYLSGYS